MPRRITPTTPEPFDVFTLDELEPDARQHAITYFAQKLGGDWWDQHNIDEVSESIVYALAQAFRSPEWDTKGEGDFPGIDGVTLDGWDLDRADYIGLKGTLTRENAPALPWVAGIDCVRLTARRDYTTVDVETYYDEDTEPPATPDEVDAMSEAVTGAMHAAKKAGRDQIEFVGSDENAEQHIEANGYEFLADGTKYDG